MSQATRRPLLLLWAAAAFPLGVRFLRRSLQRSIVAVEVSGGSMAPALRGGDFILVRRRRLPRDAFGMVAYLRGPAGRPLLKRIVGVPGDSVRAGPHVEIHGRPLRERYAHGEPLPRRYRGVHQLAPDEYFVLGDHRATSMDSRDFGPVRAADIHGVAWIRYWPPGRMGRLMRPKRVFEGGGSDSRPDLVP